MQNDLKPPWKSQNNPKGDLNWPRTTESDPKLLKTRQNDPKGDLNWHKTIQNDPKQPKTIYKET